MRESARSESSGEAHAKCNAKDVPGGSERGRVGAGEEHSSS